MENSHKFFCNHECKYFPCHSQPKPEEFNCLFCYCPLYTLGEECGGNFEYYNGTKSCVNCHLPHVPTHYDNITSKLKHINNEAHNAIIN
ncbi:MAG: cysteine-rich small domain-containing protein [Defluviitaleaceae bacterium]|nr:cysteine-rich small domain-containing protein [Defluviitaleaceae bacterium]